MGNESLEAEGDALQGLLDAFPVAPLELIASAYIQAHSDRELAAEIISFSLNGISSKPSSNNISSEVPNVIGNRTSGKSSKPASNAKGLPGTPASFHHYPLSRAKGPCPPTLEEYFPSAQDKNAWVEPLSQRLQEDVILQEMQHDTSSEDFPCLEKQASKVNRGRMCASGLLQPLGIINESTSRASATFGLASSARSRSHNGNLTKPASTMDKDSRQRLKQSKYLTDKVVETSLWPTDSEAFLLSMLGDDFNLDIEAVRDVLGYYKGDVQKSFEVLQQLSSSSLSNDQVHEEVSKSGIMSQENSGSLECFKEVEGNVEIMTKVDTCSTTQSHALKTYYAFEKALLQHENSSMKWVVECLCNKYPHAEMDTLLEVLRATNFDLNDAEKMLQEAGLHEGSPCSEIRQDPCLLAKAILESLFSKPQEAGADCQENCKEKTKRQTKAKAAGVKEMLKWKAVTSTEVDLLGDEEGTGYRKAPDVAQVNKVPKGSEITTSEKEGRTSYGDWDDYERHQASAKQHWKTMQSYLTAATAAYAASDSSKAEVLTEKGNTYKQLAMEAKERANTFLLEIKSQQNESDFTLDLHEQHIPEALQLLRLHLKSFSSIPSCHMFTVVTGCFENPKSGHKKIKQEVVGYLEKKGYKWVETTPFCLQIQMRETKQV